MESERIWLTFTQDPFGRAPLSNSTVRGNPAAWGWLVIAMAITVPERSLKMSWLMTRTGRLPVCSRPRVGSRSAQNTSPLSTRAMIPDRKVRLLQRDAARSENPVSHTPGPAYADRADQFAP